jgi:hypothetical protein
MSFPLPPVGTNRLLELLSPYAPDDFIAGICPRAFTGGILVMFLFNRPEDVPNNSAAKSCATGHC